MALHQDVMASLHPSVSGAHMCLPVTAWQAMCVAGWSAVLPVRLYGCLSVCLRCIFFVMLHLLRTEILLTPCSNRHNTAYVSCMVNPHMQGMWQIKSHVLIRNIAVTVQQLQVSFAREHVASECSVATLCFTDCVGLGFEESSED